jgi:hypothetical protein
MLHTNGSRMGRLLAWVSPTMDQIWGKITWKVYFSVTTKVLKYMSFALSGPVSNISETFWYCLLNFKQKYGRNCTVETDNGGFVIYCLKEQNSLLMKLYPSVAEFEGSKLHHHRTVELKQNLNLQQSSSHINQHSDRHSTGISMARQLRTSDIDVHIPFMPIIVEDREMTHHGRQEDFQCMTCGKSYRYKKNMMRHIRFECGKEPQFQCPYCPHQTKHKSSIQIHIRNRHPDVLN